MSQVKTLKPFLLPIHVLVTVGGEERGGRRREGEEEGERSEAEEKGERGKRGGGRGKEGG